MHVTLVQVQVKPEYVQEFIEASQRNHVGSRREPGNRRFDVLQSADDPTGFILYEAYDSQADATAHKSTPHYLAWRDAVAPWMAAPRAGLQYQALFPATPDAARD